MYRGITPRTRSPLLTSRLRRSTKKTGGAWLLQTDVATIKSEIQNGKLKIG